MAYEIIGKYKNFPKEVVDTAEDRKEANYLLSEYRLAYGSEWSLSLKRVKGE
jgi:hypothetical protein